MGTTRLVLPKVGIWLKAGSIPNPRLKTLVVEYTGKETFYELPLTTGSATLNLDRFYGERLMVKLFDGGYLMDERVVSTL